jgi:hypothetical protein
VLPGMPRQARGEGGVMTEQEAFAAGWHASQSSDPPMEIREDEQLMAAWFRGLDEGCQARFDEAYSPDQKRE